MGVFEIIAVIVFIILLCKWGIYEGQRAERHKKFMKDLEEFDKKNKTK